jgi:hypothetical protein
MTRNGSLRRRLARWLLAQRDLLHAGLGPLPRWRFVLQQAQQPRLPGCTSLAGSRGGVAINFKGVFRQIVVGNGPLYSLQNQKTKQP